MFNILNYNICGIIKNRNFIRNLLKTQMHNTQNSLKKKSKFSRVQMKKKKCSKLKIFVILKGVEIRNLAWKLILRFK